MKRLIYLICSISFFFFQKINAQDAPPAYSTPLERASMDDYYKNHNASTGIETPPTGDIRPMAEWEELQAVLISWESGTTGNLADTEILTEIVRAVSQECKAIVSCDTNAEIATVTDYLTARGVDLTNVEFVVTPTNSIWIRDYGPNCVYKDDVDSLFLVDWIYNRNRPQDDLSSRAYADFLDIPLYSTTAAPYDLVHTGGNFMTDGIGKAFSSELVFEENDGMGFGQSTHNEAAIDSILYKFMGVEEYLKMENLPFDAIHHIDMHMKLLDEETLLVGEYPEGVADGPQIEANIQYVLDNMQTSFGTDYKIIRIPMPPDRLGRYPGNFNSGDYRTYANALIVNKTILVPFYEEKYDTTAQRIWEEAKPGYNIVGINSDGIIFLSGALHCITKEIGVADQLRIVHQQLSCQDNNTLTSYPVEAMIQHRSGIESAQVFWSISPTGPFTAEPMTPLGNDMFTASIPMQSVGLEVFYYIDAEAVNGKKIQRPMVAPAGTWSFCVEQTMHTDSPMDMELQPIFPNPARAITCIPIQSAATIPSKISLVNALGQEVHTVFTGEVPRGESKYFFNAQDFDKGVYWIQIATEHQLSSQKVIIK